MSRDKFPVRRCRLLYGVHTIQKAAPVAYRRATGAFIAGLLMQKGTVCGHLPKNSLASTIGFICIDLLDANGGTSRDHKLTESDLTLWIRPVVSIT